MAAENGTRPATQRVSKESVAKQFVKLYYSILNTHHECLHQFYGKESAIVVSEMLEGGKTMTDSADTHEGVQELLRSLYDEVDVRVDTSVPQFTLEGSVLLLITGVMTRKAYGDERIFTQALLLMPQENGYFIRTDTVHVLGKARTMPIMDGFDSRAHEEPKILSSDMLEGQEMSPTAPQMHLDPSGGMVYATGATPEGDPAYVEMHYGGVNGAMDFHSTTPPTHEVDPHLGDRAKSTDSDEDRNAQRTYTPSGLPPTHGGMRSSASRRLPVSSAIPMAGPVPMPPMSIPGGYSHLPHHPGHRRDMSMSMSMSMNMHMNHAPPPVHPIRRRSLSMGADPRVLSAPPGHGVFIARLPFGIQPDDVLEAFSLFGPVLGEADGIQVRDGRNGCYAFVTFESAASANAAIQKGAVVQGKRVYVEPRYPRQEADPPHTVPASVPVSVPVSVPPVALRSGIPSAPRRSP